MAKGKVTLICTKCGATFWKEKHCTNRAAANSWEEWAKDYYDLCPDCEKEAYRELQRQKGLIVSFRLDWKETRERNQVTLEAYFSGDPYNRKEDLKAFGCVWDGYNWVISFPYAEYEAQKERIISILGANVEEEEDDHTIQLALERVEKNSELRAEYDQEQADKLAELGNIPSFPAEFTELRSGRKWNGRIYGGKQKSVYFDGSKVEISNELAAEVEKIMALREKWIKKRDSIQISFSDWKKNKN